MDKRTKLGFSVVVLSLAALAAGIYMPGCVTVRVPEELRDPGEPVRIPLVDAEAKYETKAKALGQFAVDIRGGQRQAEFFRSLGEAFMAEVNIAGQNVPGWTLLTVLGSSLFGGGLMIRRPGDKTQEDVDAAWTEAQKEATELIKLGTAKLKEELNG